MRVLIIGSGNAGRNLASRLCEEKHDVVLVDERPEALQEVQQHLDVLAIEGNGASPAVLEKAEIHKTDLLIAVTNRDEVNLLACIFAKLAGVPHKVARVNSLEFLNPTEPNQLKQLGIDLVVSQKEECAQELYQVLRMPGATEAVDLLEGRVLAVGMRVHMDSPLLRQPLNAFPKSELLQKIRFIANKRGDEILTPRGESRFMVGDEIFFVGEPADIAEFMEWAWPEQAQFNKVVIAGGTDVGIRLGQLLEPMPMKLVLLEPDQDRADYCSKRLQRTLVIRGQPTSDEAQREAGVNEENTAFVAVTDDDENNIIGCLLAQKMGARYTLAQVGKLEYAPIIDNLSLLDHVVSPQLAMVNAILHFTRGKHVRAAATLRRLPGELLDMVLPGKSRWAGKAIKSLTLPAGVTIAAGLRGDQVLHATGDLVLAPGDRLVLYSPPSSVAKVIASFKK